jgi:hypothetical protein
MCMGLRAEKSAVYTLQVYFCSPATYYLLSAACCLLPAILQPVIEENARSQK